MKSKFISLDGPHDTMPSIALSRTYKESLKFPHEDILESLRIPTSYDWGTSDIRYLVENSRKWLKFLVCYILQQVIFVMKSMLIQIKNCSN